MEQNLAQATLPATGITTNYNLSTMVYFQFVFAAITVIILGGSLLGRINLLAWMAFVPLWITFSNTAGAFGGFFISDNILWDALLTVATVSGEEDFSLKECVS